MIKEIEKFNDKLVSTPLFINKQKKYVTVTKKVPNVAIIDRKSVSTFSNKGENHNNMKPKLNMTHRDMSATKTYYEDLVSVHDGQSSYRAHFSPTGFIK